MTALSHYTPGSAGTAGDGFRLPAPRDPQPTEQRPRPTAPPDPHTAGQRRTTQEESK